MKKFFTLISVALFAMSVNAQESFDVADLTFTNEEVKPGTTAPVLQDAVESSNTSASFLITKEQHQFPLNTYPDNVNLVTEWLNSQENPSTYAISLKEYTFTKNTGHITLKAVSTPNSDALKNEGWQKSTNTNEALNTDDCPIKFNNYVKPKNGDPSLAYYDFYDLNSDDEPVHRVSNVFWTPGCGSLPGKGCYYEFTSDAAGTLLVAACMWKNLPQRPLYIIDESTSAAGYTVLAKDKISVAGFLQNNGWDGWHGKVWHEFQLNDDFILTEKNTEEVYEIAPNSRTFFGYITFHIDANKTYMVMNPNNQMGLYGYYFNPDTPSGITDITKNVEESVNAPVYNLAGQKVNASAKGLLIKNGKKFIVK